MSAHSMHGDWILYSSRLLWQQGWWLQMWFVGCPARCCRQLGKRPQFSMVFLLENLWSCFFWCQKQFLDFRYFSFSGTFRLASSGSRMPWISHGSAGRHKMFSWGGPHALHTVGCDFWTKPSSRSIGPVTWGWPNGEVRYVDTFDPYPKAIHNH